MVKKTTHWGLERVLCFKSHHRIYSEFVTRTSFPRPTLLTRASPCASICHDLEDSSPKSGLNYSVWLTESHTTPFLCFQTPIPEAEEKKNTNTSKEEAARAQTASRYLRLSNTARQPFSWLQRSLSLLQPEGLPPPIRINTAISFKGISPEQVLHWSNNLHVRWITWLLINDTIDTSTSEMHFL